MSGYRKIARIASIAALLALASLPVDAQDAGLDLDIMMQEVPGTMAPEAEMSPLDKEFLAAIHAYRSGDFEMAHRRWQELSDAGHGLSTFNLAVMSMRGHGVPRDAEKAMTLLEDAASKDVGAAFHALGMMRLADNSVEAMRLFRNASDLGHISATYNLALMHLQGIGGEIDHDQGMELLEVAATSGLAQAKYDLATMLVANDSVDDQVRARRLFEEAAEAGDPFAHYNLALMQLSGRGGDVDKIAAHKNLSTAAELGAIPAQVRLAHLLATGVDGISRDREQAFMWFWIAADFGAEGARENAKRLATKMDPAVVQRAKYSADAYRPMGSTGRRVVEKTEDDANPIGMNR